MTTFAVGIRQIQGSLTCMPSRLIHWPSGLICKALAQALQNGFGWHGVHPSPVSPSVA